MTSSEEIERLLQMTGRTLEGLPKLYSSPEAEAAITVAGDTRIQTGNMLLHQSDVIELLVGALRDALDKPMQKPLTLDEVSKCDHPVWIEFKVFTSANGWREGVADALYWAQRVYQDMTNPELGVAYRLWASRPTDEEREAAAWES